MKKLFKTVLCLCLISVFVLCGCGKDKGPGKYEFTTQRPDKIMIPSVTYGCDLYTADLPSLRKMGSVMFRGENFGALEDEAAAVKAAVAAVYEVYGTPFDGYEPLVCTFNERAGCWIVHGTPHDNRNTGMTFVGLRKSNGEVVMVRKNPKD